MTLNHKSIRIFEKLILVFLNIFNLFRSKNIIRILVYHHVEKKDFKKLNNQLKNLKKNWNFITPKQFENHINKKDILKGRNLLVTFDDGFKSNFFVEKEVLDKLKIKAIFFVPSDFIKFNSIKKSQKFLNNNILDHIKPKDFRKLRNMTADDLKILSKKGHEIGCHTKTHANLGQINDISKLKKEIIKSSKVLRNLLKKNVKHFAYSYGNYKSMNDKSLKIAFQNYDYIYSCLRGNNFYNYTNNLIKRDPVYLDSSNDLLKIFLSGFIDLKYFFQLKKLNNKIIKMKH
jgi:peptidoglycan/xylan/chitin deacetylase (PgdA/CDA1 family)